MKREDVKVIKLYRLAVHLNNRINTHDQVMLREYIIIELI